MQSYELLVCPVQTVFIEIRYFLFQIMDAKKKNPVHRDQTYEPYRQTMTHDHFKQSGRNMWRTPDPVFRLGILPK